MERTSKYPNKAGIYKLTCIKNGKVYIGKSVLLSNRLSRHKTSKEHNGKKWHLESSIIKHGWDSFEVEILEVFEDFDKSKDNELLLERESYYIELFNSTDRSIGYNKCKKSTDCTGFRHTEETKKKMSVAQKGKKMSPEAIEKTRQFNLGRKNTEESKKKMSLARLGTTCSEETREKFRNRRLSEETKEKLRQVHLGKPKSPEHIEKVRQANIGRKHTEETKAKMRETKAKNKQKNE